MQKHAFKLSAHGTPETVRTILADMRLRLEGLGVSEDDCGTVEIAIAEALNNIVEHAYAPSCEGPLWMQANLRGNALTLDLRDEGRPLPGLNLPHSQLPDATGPLDDLPEGGFGWFLIHTLSHALNYSRDGSENHLNLEFRINSKPN